MTRFPLLLALLLVAPVLSGCMSEAEEPAAASAVGAQSAEAAGARSGEAPVAPKGAYAVEGSDAMAYPIAVETNAARAPALVDFSGEFTPGDCRPLNFGPLEEALVAASEPRRFRSLADALQVGDVFRYNITLAYTNAADNWGEIHLEYGLGSTVQGDREPTREKTDVVVSFSGQGFRASEDDMAWLFVGCEFGAMQRAIPYTLIATFTFAEGAVPAEAPLLLSVPEGASKLYVRGVPIDDSEGVQSHFRIFRPDDTLLCECGLSSADELTIVDLPETGDYVLIVDHTTNGFVSVALDAPSDMPMRALGAEWVETSVLSQDGGPVDLTIELNLERVPLVMFAHVMQKDAAGIGKRTTLDIANARGNPLRVSWGGHLAWEDPVGGSAWLGFWPGDWEFVQDHHAYAQGHHTAKVTAEELRGEILLVTRQYVR